jgi:hypothetical protein
MTILPPRPADWPADRVAEARAVIADIAHHRDYLIRLACTVLVAHGESPEEREEARRLLVVVDARTPLRLGYHQQRDDAGDADGNCGSAAGDE